MNSLQEIISEETELIIQKYMWQVYHIVPMIYRIFEKVSSLLLNITVKVSSIGILISGQSTLDYTNK